MGWALAHFVVEVDTIERVESVESVVWIELQATDDIILDAARLW